MISLMISRMISRMAWGPADHYDASAPHIIPTGQHLQPAYATFLMGVLQSNTVLTELVLSSNELRDEGAIALAKQLGPGKRIVTILCDTGFRYLSTIYNPAWMRSKNLPIMPWQQDS